MKSENRNNKNDGKEQSYLKENMRQGVKIETRIEQTLSSYFSNLWQKVKRKWKIIDVNEMNR